MIEHNLDVIKTADCLIDLGPEGGDEGGTVVAQGTPEEVAGTPGSHTGEFLAELVTPAAPKARRATPRRRTGGGEGRRLTRERTREETTMITTLDFVGIPSQDAERARAFYVDTLGLRPDEHSRFEFWAGDTCFAIWEPEQMGMPFAPQKNAHPALHVDDVEAARAATRGQGRGVLRRDLRHRRLPHGVLHRPRRQRPHAPPPLRAARLTACSRSPISSSGSSSGAGTSARACRGTALALHRELAARRAFAKGPLNGEVLELLREGRLEIGEGTLLEPNVWITGGEVGRIRIGQGVFLNQGVMVAAVDLVEIGDHCMAANGCMITDGNHRFDDPTKPVTWQGFDSKGPTRLGDNVWLGANVVVTSGVTIGDRCVVGSNSVVTRDLPPGTIAAGSPATVIREIEFKR